MTLRRRDWVKWAALTSATTLLPETRARALTPPNDGKLVIVVASGGWDPSYALDPKADSSIVDAPEGDVATFAEIEILTHASRPSVAGFFERFADQVAVVRGVQVRSFIHSDCMKRMLTGTASDKNPDLGAIAAYERGRDLPIPYLVLGNSAYSGPLAPITGRAGTTNQISALLATEAMPDPLLPAGGYQPTGAEDQLAREYLKASAERLRATRGALGGNARQIDAFAQGLDRQGLLRAFAEERGGFGAREYTPDLGVQVNVALDALEGDLAHTVQLESMGWDTHQNNSDQGALHEALFNGLLRLVGGLEERGLLDRTVVLVTSEMGRTPKLNANAGKDHWPVTTAMVLGAGVRGGRSLGGTTDELAAQSVDLATGEVNAAGSQLQTTNLVAGVLALAGVDPAARFPGTEPLTALYL